MNSLNISHRFSLRGLRKCVSCGKYNGSRAHSCRNQECPLSKLNTTSKNPSKAVDIAAHLAVQLQTKGDAFLYSVPNREKNPIRRSFVQITDRTISSDEDGCIISRNAICFVDTCKYDSHDVNISCKHIKWALECSSQAKVTPIAFDVWKSVRKPDDEVVRNRTWAAYQSALDGTPMVQQINDHSFAVACDVSTEYPAGRLHVRINNGKAGKQHASNPGGLECSCKNYQTGNRKTVLNAESCTSNTCDHVCLVLAAIKSCPKLGLEFKHAFAEYSGYFPELDNDSTISGTREFEDQTLCLPITDDFIKFSEDILNHSADDLVDVSSHTIPIPSILTADDQPDCGALIDLDSIKIINDPTMVNDLHNLELIDCQIELMDQFKLTDHIDLSSNEIHLDDADDLFGNSIVDLSSLVGIDLKLDPIVETAPKPIATSKKSIIGSKVNRRQDVIAGSKTHRIPRFDPNAELSESLMFEQWLESVVERVNGCLDFNGNGKPEPLVFSVCHGFFNTLSTRFATGVKRRLPLVSTIDLGTRTGLARFTWKFSNADIIKNIFKSQTSPSICDERIFRKCSNGRYKLVPPEKHRNLRIANESSIGRPIRPTKFSTMLKLKPAAASPSSSTAAVFTIEWIPNVLPISRFGEMRLVFQFWHMKNNRIVDDMLAI